MRSLLLLVIAAQLAVGMPEPEKADIAWVAEGEFCEPETVLPLPDNTLLVSNVCDFRTRGNGFLTLLSADGSVINWRVVENLDAPLGMALVDDLLHVVDNNQIKIFRWPEFRLHSTIALDTAVANDIAVAQDHTIYVTDTARHEVVVISVESEQSILTGRAQFKGANGIHIQDDDLYVGGARLSHVDLRDNTVTRIGPDWLVDIDGIEMEADGTLQITPVGGPLIRLDKPVEVLGGDGISSANHGYAANLDLALIPTGFDNTVVAIRVKARSADSAQTSRPFAGGDHHMHIQSEHAAAVSVAMCDAMPGECSDDDKALTAASTGTDAVRVLDEAGLNKGAILSLGYYFGVPELVDSRFDDHRYVRAENEYVAEQVGNAPDRLVGFFSVNPLAEYAVGEVSYWADHGRLAGLKLHLANSDLDFRNPDHVEKLRTIIDVMNDYRLAVVIHLRNRNSDYGYEDAALFIDQIAKGAPEVTFQLAHMAGWGGYDAETDGAVQAFLDAIGNGVLDRSKVWFDIAAVIEPQMPDEVYAALRGRFREIGFDRLLFASDWDEVAPKAYIAMLRDRLKLSDAEWEQLINNEAPYFH